MGARNAVAGADHLAQLAALPSVPRREQNSLTTNAVDLAGTLKILLTACDPVVGRITMVS